MKKPHEQEWKRIAHAGFALSNLVVTNDERQHLICQPKASREEVIAGESDTAEEALSKFIAAAPDMARALLGLGEEDEDGNWHLSACVRASYEPCLKDCTSARAVLTKAGVLP